MPSALSLEQELLVAKGVCLTSSQLTCPTAEATYPLRSIERRRRIEINHRD
uniref:Uncharacterized protein n=1 Tax=Aegilops tauschii subsp. strangulata TaxID=200361 RepID=A0A453NJF6_AEGTS